MIFDDIFELNTLISLGRSSTRGRRFHDSHDPEVNRLFNSSPPMSQTASTYEGESLMKTGEKSMAATKSEVKTDRKGVTIIDILKPNLDGDAAVFAPLPVSGKSTFASNLSSLLEAKPSSGLMSSSSGKRVKLTIYLPDQSPFEVTVSENDCFEDVINTVLKCHKEADLRPELYYHCPEMYELRMHEGDGEPDRDFPALDKRKSLKSFNLNEYCLCETDEEYLNIENEEIDTALAGVKMGRFGDERGDRNYDDTRDSDFGDVASSQHNTSSHANVGDDAILIIIPNADNLKLAVDEDTTLKGLLPQIAELLACRGHKLRLHADEFSFVLTPDDQARLKVCVTSSVAVQRLCHSDSCHVFLDDFSSCQFGVQGERTWSKEARAAKEVISKLL
jgi:hypothetical protein